MSTVPEKKQPRGPWSLGAGTVVVDQERVLLVRNRYGVTKGRYLLPAGRVHPGELPDRTAERETWEETGLRVEVTGLLGVRVWVMENGEHNYFFMFQARLLSPLSDLQPNLDEVDDARFFTRAELAALNPDETWAGALAIVYKALDGEASVWPNDPTLANESGVEMEDHWRIWL
jgi:8-oxo-dGTP pyrophosphatase MutT (NUDIX family)